MPIGQNSFAGGWSPNDDFLMGGKQDLLLCDNMTLDSVGALTLANGSTFVATIAGLTSGFSVYLNNQIRRYAFGTNNLGPPNSSGSIYRSDNYGAYNAIITNAWEGGYLVCGSGFNVAFLAVTGGAGFGTGFYKDWIAGHVIWGLSTPNNAPSVAVNTTPPYINIIPPAGFASCTVIEGTFVSSGTYYYAVSANSTTNRASIQYYFGSTTPLDCTAFSDGGQSTDNDLFTFNVQVPDSTLVVSIRVTFYLDSGGVSAPGDYYFYEWDAANTASIIPGGSNVTSVLNVQRGQFQRQGNTPNANWTTVYAVVVTFQLNATSSGNNIIRANFQITGGSNAQLYGGTGTGFSQYQYFQTYVDDSNGYIGQSPISRMTPQITAIATSATITPYVDSSTPSNVNKIYIYRVGGTLGVPYLVGISTGSGSSFPAIVDGRSDAQIVTENIIANTFLTQFSQILHPVVAIVGPVAGRIIIVTTINIIFTDYLNPEAFDARLVLSMSGAVGETILWSCKLGASTVVVGTNIDIYQVTGSFQQLADGTFDVNILALGLLQPPVNSGFAIKDYSLFYNSSDGVKSLTFSLTQTLSGKLQMLYRNENPRYGVPPISTSVGNPETLSGMPQIMAYYKGKLGNVVQHTDGSYALIEYDAAVTQSWTRRVFPNNTIPMAIYTEPDGTAILLTNNNIYELNVGTTKQFGGTNQNVNIIFPPQDGGNPVTRKDLFTLKVLMAGGPININLFNENYTQYAVGNLVDTGGQVSLMQFDLSVAPIGQSKWYGLQVSNTGSGGIGTEGLTIYNWSVDYLERPPQDTFIRVLPTNLGTSSRKRFIQYAIIVDTLNSPCVLTVIVDGVAVPATLTFTTPTNIKSTVVYTFTSEVIGIDIGHNITAAPGQVFEYYGISLDECVSEKMPPLSDYLVIPNSNFGTAAPKRIRTIPLVINTFGQNVQFTPVVDGVQVGPPAVFNTTSKRTVYYYFNSDVFGTDYGGILQFLNTPGPGGPIFYGQGFFEFYGDTQSGGFQQPAAVNVETLPPPKTFDQLGPYQMDKRGKLLEMRIRMLANSPSVNYTIFMDDYAVFSSSLIVQPGKDSVYECKFPKTLIGAVLRVELSSSDGTSPFYRWYAQFRVILSGMQTEAKWITVPGNDPTWAQRTAGAGYV